MVTYILTKVKVSKCFPDKKELSLAQIIEINLF